MTCALAEASVWQRFCEHAFYQEAMLGSVAIALACSVLSVFVVLKRMAFIGQGISHAAFGGVGVALLAGLVLDAARPALARDGIIACFCVAAAVVIGWLSRRGRLGEDTAIGIILVAAMALGVVLLDVRGRVLEWLIATGRLARGEVGYTPSFHEILFGNIFFIGRGEIILAWVLAAAVVVAVALLFKQLVFFAFDEEAAAAFGVRTGALYYGLLVFLGLAIVAAMRGLGVIMASALLVLPAAAARLWSDRIGRVTWIAAGIGVGGVAGGLLLSIALRHVSPAAVIVLVLLGIFAGSGLARAVRRRAARGR